VAAGLGIKLPYPDAGRRAAEVAKATAANYSSMARDAARGAPTEIEPITGAIVGHGRQAGVATPVNGALLTLVRGQLQGADWRAQVGRLPADIRPLFEALLAEEKAHASHRPN
ncbi:MAG: ketopantoate reductase family protein, partial [Candidatus Promineifilaceae bacterium]